MLFFAISFISFVILVQKLQQPLPSWAIETTLLSTSFIQDSISFLVNWSRSYRPVGPRDSDMPPTPSKRRCNGPLETDKNADEVCEFSVLDLPDLALECILEKLSPAALSKMSTVCSSLNEKCRSDYLWEQHMQRKWGKVIGPAARREWKLHLASMRVFGGSANGKLRNRWLQALSYLLPISCLKSQMDGAMRRRRFAPDDSLMCWYQSLETGKFWFPAQVYNREHGHVGFILSCYDAEVSYDRHSDTFHARYPPHGRRTIVIEEGVQWERLRAPPVDTPAHELHASDCLNELRPGDHIEIQWRRNKEFPYGWWYGTVGHLESCDGHGNFCRCHLSDTVILEFSQYTIGSRWRHASISRKDHTEEGSESDGFYGGIRKLKSEEITKWKQLWPTDILE